ncbi:MAG: PH domain-containing protein [Bacteroidales bacterium]|nr:PH domain-containing protein [Bacteroidales bacterium]
MIDFNNGSFCKLKKVDNASMADKITPLLIEGEEIISSYKAIRDFVIFTNKRLITANVQGITGSKKDLTSLPYKKISVYSIETAGTFDLDCELELYFSGVGKIKLEFSGSTDIIEIGKLIASYML